MSRQYNRGDPAHGRLGYDEAAPVEPYDPNVPRLRGSEAPHYSNGAAGDPWFVDTSAATGQPGQPTNDDFYEVPASDFYAARSYAARDEASTVAGGHVPNGGHFDFNDNQQPNPWHDAELQGSRAPEPVRDFEPEIKPERKIEFRRFATCHDKDLNAYLAARLISTGFLTEIDLFLQGHPELTDCPEGRTLLHEITVMSPLEAYRHFLKGYTRPARYVNGVLRTETSTLPPNFSYQALSSKSDPELIEFFDGYDFRYDIIERIDNEVYAGIREWVNGRHISPALRKLICYAVWGNPVDAYKFFEYSYQDEYMPHIYLAEHVVLGHVPKPTNDTEPRPSMLSGYKKHGDVRARMARANDQGVDVLEVLIAEYRFALVRRAHRRGEIDDLVRKAKERLDKERQDPTGIDIVDLIMDDAVSRQGTNRRHETRPTKSRYQKTYNFGTCRVTFRGRRFNGVTPTFTRFTAGRAPGLLQAQAAELHHAKATLLRLYAQEQHAISKRGMNTRQSTLEMVRARRASAERRYVNCLIRYCRSANYMTAFQANQLQKDFTREKMRDHSVPNSDYLLGMYPRELY